MFGEGRAPRIGRLPERWRATVPGITANVVLCDPASGSVFVSDGWAVNSSASLRVHRLDLATGRHLAEARTRHQVVHARDLIWCLVEKRRLLQAASSVDGGVRASCRPGLSHPGQLFCHVDPAAGLAFALDPHIESESAVVRSATSTLAWYELPSLAP